MLLVDWDGAPETPFRNTLENYLEYITQSGTWYDTDSSYRSIAKLVAAEEFNVPFPFIWSKYIIAKTRAQNDIGSEGGNTRVRAWKK
jgi:hypothetical protein